MALDCDKCRAAGADAARLCWLDDDERPVYLAGVGPFILDKETLQGILPHEEALQKIGLLSHEGRPICPVPLATHDDLADLLQMEADLDGWHLPPLPGGTLDWPEHLVIALRHVRGTKGLIQLKGYKERECSTNAAQ